MFNYAMFDRYEGLIFDMDGTLIDTMPVHAKAWGMVGKQFGYEFDSQIMYNLGGAQQNVLYLISSFHHNPPCFLHLIL